MEESAGSPIKGAEEMGVTATTPSHHQRRLLLSLFTVTLLLLVFFESINPPESYIHQFLARAKHLPEHDIHRYAIPFFTYGQLIGFLPLSMLSELAGKCPYVIGLVISLRFGSSLLHLLSPASLLLPHQIARGMYGLASAGKVAIKAHVYEYLPHDTYITITGYMRAVNLIAHVMGGTLGWLFYRNELDWSVAFSVHIACLSAAIIAFVANSLVCSSKTKTEKSLRKKGSFCEFMHTSRNTYATDRVLAGFVIWVIVMDALQLSFHTMKSSLIQAVDPRAKSNGLAVAACRLSSAFVTFIIGRYPHLTNGFQIQWLNGAAVVMAALMFMAGNAWHVYIVYGAFLIYSVISDAFICIVTAHIALKIPASIRGWVLFGNQFLGIVIASLVQFVLGTILSLSIRHLYFGIAVISLSLPFLSAAILRTCPDHSDNIENFG